MKLGGVFKHVNASCSVLACLVQIEDKKHKKLKDFSKDDLKQAIEASRKYVRRRMEEVGAPGMVVGVSVDGRLVWSEGFGMSDVENAVTCRSDAVMRVGSISKSFTSLAVAHLWENGKLDLDASIQRFVPYFPVKFFRGEKTDITLRQLLSHLGGIRHYTKKEKKSCMTEEKKGEEKKTTSKEDNTEEKKPSMAEEKTQEDEKDEEIETKEWESTKHYERVDDALQMFVHDDLVNLPGSKYLYTTHGWTVISKAVEAASGRNFLPTMQHYFHLVGMWSTRPDLNDPIIYGRSRYYRRNKKGQLENVPYVDNSYKWAGGGFLSNVEDVLKFANAMLYCYQNTDDEKEDFCGVRGILKSATVRKMWSVVSTPPRSEKSRDRVDQGYGMGWVVYPQQEEIGACPERPLEVGHTGGSVGASSVLLIVTRDDVVTSSPHDDVTERTNRRPRGVAVAVITNMEGVGLTLLARDVAREFAAAASSP